MPYGHVDPLSSWPPERAAGEGEPSSLGVGSFPFPYGHVDPLSSGPPERTAEGDHRPRLPGVAGAGRTLT